MKILMLTPYLPYPLLSGGQIRSYNLLSQLSQKHEISLFSFIRRAEEEKYVPELLKFCREVKVFKRRPAWSWINIVLSGFTPFPFLVSIYYSWTLRGAIAKALESHHYDLIHSETFYVMPNIPQTSVPILLAEQTIEYLVYQHFVESLNFLPFKYFLKIDVAKIKYWEKFFWRRAKKVVAMSQADKGVMTELDPTLNVSIVPNGVDTVFFSTQITKKGKIPTVLFVGNFKWLQNREAVEVLVKKIWPEIRQRMTKVKLWIVGRFPTKEILNYQNNDIRIMSDVEDIRNIYQSSNLLLAPIYGPGGTRYKILEAMASGLPVVTTSKGIEGLGAVNTVHAVICDSVSDLASQTVKLLQDEALKTKLINNGKKLIRNNYEWESIAHQLDGLYEEVSRG